MQSLIYNKLSILDHKELLYQFDNYKVHVSQK